MHVYLWGNLPVRLATQRKCLRKFNLPLLATTTSPFGQGLTPRTDNRPAAFPDQVAVLQKIPSNDDANVAEVTNPEYPL